MKIKRYFEWIDGENKGNVVSLVSITDIDGETFYNFDDGESCNLRFISKMTKNVVDLKEKFMVEVENPHNIWTFDTIETSMPRDIQNASSDDVIPTLHDIINSDAGGGSSIANVNNSDIGKEKLVPPKRVQAIRSLPRKEDYEETPEMIKESIGGIVPISKSSVTFVEKVTSEPAVPEPASEPVSMPVEAETVTPEPVVPRQEEKHEKRANDPIAILVDSCKKHSTSIPLTLTIDLPMKSLYNIANEEFEDGGDKFISYIVNGINTDVIIEALKGALKSAYDVTENDDNTEEE